MHTTKKNRDNHSEISLHQQDNSVLKSNKSGTFAMLAKAYLCPGEFDNDKFWKHIYREQKTYQQGLVSSIRNKEGNLDFIYGKDPLLCFIGKYNEDADVYACWPELKSVLTSLGECFKDKEHLKEIVADCL